MSNTDKVQSIDRRTAVTLFCEIANRRLHDAECFNLTENMRLAIAEFADAVLARSAMTPSHSQDAPLVRRNTFTVKHEGKEVEVVFASFAACLERSQYVKGEK